eukprot:TRINITY_DN94750_c0_g1_i1.p1 TRINITY_DN94750_c0_g1~~TRINITY_DN94750_c0_g1_i1.p1  ORF type:complete len:551 (-),score=102.66 TRINITY_DN94750_c0_g1_i1:36-1592(-)
MGQNQSFNQPRQIVLEAPRQDEARRDLARNLQAKSVLLVGHGGRFLQPLEHLVGGVGQDACEAALHSLQQALGTRPELADQVAMHTNMTAPLHALLQIGGRLALHQARYVVCTGPNMVMVVTFGFAQEPVHGHRPERMWTPWVLKQATGNLMWQNPCVASFVLHPSKGPGDIEFEINALGDELRDLVAGDGLTSILAEQRKGNIVEQLLFGERSFEELFLCSQVAIAPDEAVFEGFERYEAVSDVEAVFDNPASTTMYGTPGGACRSLSSNSVSSEGSTTTSVKVVYAPDVHQGDWEWDPDSPMEDAPFRPLWRVFGLSMIVCLVTRAPDATLKYFQAIKSSCCFLPAREALAIVRKVRPEQKRKDAESASMLKKPVVATPHTPERPSSNVVESISGIVERTRSRERVKPQPSMASPRLTPRSMHGSYSPVTMLDEEQQVLVECYREVLKIQQMLCDPDSLNVGQELTAMFRKRWATNPSTYADMRRDNLLRSAVKFNDVATETRDLGKRMTSPVVQD